MRQNFKLALHASVILLARVYPLDTAMAQDAASPSLVEELRAKYKLTASGSDSTGTVLEIKKEGILGVPPGNATMARQAYKDGVLHEVGKFLVPLLGQNTRYLRAGEKVYVRKLDVNLKKNEVTLLIFECDACNGATELSSYKAEVVVEFPKGSYVSRSAIMESINQVFAADATPPPTPPRNQQNVAVVERRSAPDPLPATAALKVPGTYVNPQAPTDQLQLNADSSLSLNAGGQTSRGTYSRDGNTLKISLPDLETTMTIKDGNLTDATGQVWNWRDQAAVPAPAPAAVSTPIPTAAPTPSGPALRNEDIIKLVKVGIADATIIAKIGSSKCEFDTSIDALIQLKKGGVSTAVLTAMVEAGK